MRQAASFRKSAVRFALSGASGYLPPDECGISIMMRREYVRRPSRAARLALPPSVFAPVLAGIAILVHRLGTLSDQNFILVLLTSFAFALVGALLALLGLRALWADAAVGGRRSALALVFCAPILASAVAGGWLFQTTANLSDISTDLVDPPHFSAALPSGAGMNTNEPPRLNAVLQKQFYPGVTGRRYQLSADGIAAQVIALIVEMGWMPRSGKPAVLATGEWMVEARVTTPVLGFTDGVVIRITDEGESTFVDMRSASFFGARDLGANARRIVDYMKALDLRIQSGGTTSP